MELHIAFDPGSSLTKVVYQTETGPPKLLLMEPELTTVPQESITYLRSNSPLDLSKPEDSAWLCQHRNSAVVDVVGFLAQRLQTDTDLITPKAELGISKFLAVVGSIVQRESLPVVGVKVSAVLLLPISEYGDRELLAEQLHKALKSFYFRGQHIRAKLANWICLPEGGGFLYRIVREQGKDWLQQANAICVVMLGHRNSSLVTYSRGQVDNRFSGNSQGFIDLVNRVIERGFALTPEVVAQHLYNLGEDISPAHLLETPLVRFTQAKYRQQEAEKLSALIRTARLEYWLKLREWLNRMLPHRLDQLIVSGGAGHYLKPEFKEDFAWAEPIQWSPVSYEEEMKALIENIDSSLHHRLADVWNVFVCSFFRTHKSSEAA